MSNPTITNYFNSIGGIHDRITSTPIVPPAAVIPARIDLRDLDTFMKTHTAQIIPPVAPHLWPTVKVTIGVHK